MDPPASCWPTSGGGELGAGLRGPLWVRELDTVTAQGVNSTLPSAPRVSKGPRAVAERVAKRALEGAAATGPLQGAWPADAAPARADGPAPPSRDPSRHPGPVTPHAPRAAGAAARPGLPDNSRRRASGAGPRAHPRPGSPPVPGVDPAGPPGVVVDVEDLAVVVPGLLPAPG